jgi:hypothetical protein
MEQSALNVAAHSRQLEFAPGGIRTQSIQEAIDRRIE